jgi:hypothetical protein
MINIRNLAIIIRSAPFMEGLHFFSNERDFQQVAIWEYNKGKELAPHIHLTKPIIPTFMLTQEVVYVIEGRLMVTIYDEGEHPVYSVTLIKGDTLINLAGGHGYTVMDDGTKVLEVKNGPYFGRALDRRDI